eukprot:CAMPEP_0179454158 /NCGR_PEP_ID=MMETSP0799-20121207/38002_1 /TAXON_ID=46947 /ORGANISM="Geminigera cryophila, Strain CCMP2564" /LENGTH=224 /DNA_ID=CAMNT_0021251717 /DNA_START=217 /DNA_END=891 /DNA_ORIENTATION=-
MRSCRFAAPPADLPTTTAPLPASRSAHSLAADSAFEPLPAGALEPTAAELAMLVNEFYSTIASANSGGELGSMGERDLGVVFQGDGDPLECVGVVLETVGLVAQERNGIAFRLNTLGLCDDATLQLLLVSNVLARGDADRRRETRIATVSVFLPAADATQYNLLLQPRAGRGFADVCNFVATLADAGVDVECTAVARPDVDVTKVEALAMGLGARTFRTRSFIT